MSVTITERDRLAILGGIGVIHIYQRMIDETIELIAKIVGAEADKDMGSTYYGHLSDELASDCSPETITRNIIQHYEVTVRPDMSEPVVEGLGDAAD